MEDFEQVTKIQWQHHDAYQELVSQIPGEAHHGITSIAAG